MNTALLVLVEKSHQPVKLDLVDLGGLDIQSSKNELPQILLIQKPIKVLVHDPESSRVIESILLIPLMDQANNFVRPIKIISLLSV